MNLNYLRIARVDHWFKNVFMLPGILLGWLASPPADVGAALVSIGLGVLATCLICSSNYTINEWLDAPEDRKHPEKKNRPAAAGRVRAWAVYVQWFFLAVAGLLLAWWAAGLPLLLTELALLAMGLAYNVRPMRLKDWPYVDVLSESVNNPLRLLLGWFSVPCLLVPPVSLILSYWMLGAFLMAVKRFAEMRHIGSKEVAAAYRRSFNYYTEERLLISVVFYSAAFALFAGIFLIRYRVELILGVPFLAGFMAMYMHMGFLPDSPTQRPEHLYRNRGFVAYTVLTSLVLIVSMVIRLPWLSRMFEATIPAAN
jgi:4-hydroxybenzoate polyprenyltransferase